MNGLPYYKAYPRDFIEGTIGLAFEVKCAYRVVLDLIYLQGGNLPDDARYISGVLNCSIRKWKSIRETLIEAGKITVSGEFLTNYRAVSELETLSKLQDKQRENASGARKNKGLEKPRHRHTEPEPYKERDTNVSPKKNTRGSRLPNDFEPDISFAMSLGLSESQAKAEATKFKEWWPAQPGQKGVKLDWGLTWKTWARKSAERSPSNIPSRANQPRRQTAADVLFNIAEEMENAERGEGNREIAGILPAFHNGSTR